jgi:hypothetical protein
MSGRIITRIAIAIGWTNFAAVTMEIKKGGFKKNLDFSSNFMKHRRNIQRRLLREIERTKMSGRIITRIAIAKQ